MAHDVLKGLEQTIARITIACRQILGEGCSPADKPTVLLLLWGIARAAADRITNNLSPESTQLLLRAVLSALKLQSSLEGQQPPGQETLAKEVGLITAFLDSVLRRETEAPYKCEPPKQEGQVSKTLDLTAQAWDELEGGEWDEKDEDVLVTGFLQSPQREHRLTAMRELGLAKSFLAIACQTVQPLPTVTDPTQD